MSWVCHSACNGNGLVLSIIAIILCEWPRGTREARTAHGFRGPQGRIQDKILEAAVCSESRACSRLGSNDVWLNRVKCMIRFQTINFELGIDPGQCWHELFNELIRTLQKLSCLSLGAFSSTLFMFFCVKC